MYDELINRLRERLPSKADASGTWESFIKQFFQLTGIGSEIIEEALNSDGLYDSDRFRRRVEDAMYRRDAQAIFLYSMLSAFNTLTLKIKENPQAMMELLDHHPDVAQKLMEEDSPYVLIPIEPFTKQKETSQMIRALIGRGQLLKEKQIVLGNSFMWFCLVADLPA